MRALEEHQLSADEARSLFDLDRSTGQLRWKQRVARNVFPGDVAGYVGSEGYIEVGIKGRKVLAHRIVWLLAHGEWPSKWVVHANDNVADNRPENLELGAGEAGSRRHSYRPLRLINSCRTLAADLKAWAGAGSLSPGDLKAVEVELHALLQLIQVVDADIEREAARTSRRAEGVAA